MGNVIALSGWRGSGKDTVANYLVTEYGYKQMSFAARLKDVVASTYGVPREDLDDPTKKEMPLTTYPAIPSDPFSEKVHLMLRDELSSGYWTPRALCILEGSIKRSVHSNFWIRSVVEQILSSSENYVISDMRYKSEADTLRLFLPDMVTVRVERFDTISTTDPSERNLDDYPFDVYLSNRGTKELLYGQVDGLVTSINAITSSFLR